MRWRLAACQYNISTYVRLELIESAGSLLVIKPKPTPWRTCCVLPYSVDYMQKGDKPIVEKRINITQVRDTLSTLVDEVQYRNIKYIILRRGKPAAAVVPLHVYESWRSNRERLFGLIAQMQESGGGHDPEAIRTLVQEAQQATRIETVRRTTDE
jgi:prevent-host-death family protein